jgi:hypothetical protein
MSPSSIAGINKLSEAEKRAVYARIIPKGLVDLFNLSPDFRDNNERANPCASLYPQRSDLP